MTDTDFASLPLDAATLANLASLGFTAMTPIQARSLPVILEGRDVLAQAGTGSGKTAAFGLGLLHSLDRRDFRCQALVLCPTRELADQVARELRRLARGTGNIKVLTLCGGVAMGPQVGSLEHGAQIIVGTPGRIEKHLAKGTLSLDGLNTLVLDEADRMLDMGFVDSIAGIVERTPARRRTLLFSATWPPAIQTLAGRFLRDPVSIKVATEEDRPDIEQRFYEVTQETRLEAVTRLLYSLRPTSCVAFCATKRQCQEVADHLNAQGVSARALNGDLEQRDRDQVLGLFANRSLAVLVATDVAARGLDIAALDLVINVEPARDPETHTHRIGRTGRAGERGLALTLVAPPEMRRALAIEDQHPGTLPWHALDQVRPHADRSPLRAPMATLCIGAGRKQKLRPGDILGALTGDAGLPGDKVGKITLFDHQAYVAVDRAVADKALQRLQTGKIKGRSLRVRRL